MNEQVEKILVIKLGALGDIFLAMKPFQDIRTFYPKANITLLTMPAFAALARSMPWFDVVITDTRPSWWDVKDWIGLAQKLTGGGFTQVFDLQNRPRTKFYRHLFFRRPDVTWLAATQASSGVIHAQDEMLQPLRAAGVADSGVLRLDWLAAPLEIPAPPAPYCILVPGCSPHRPQKRWPPQHYAVLAHVFHGLGMTSAVVGTKVDAEPIAAIKEKAPFVQDLSGQLSLAALASLFRGARYVVGNDTGPTQLAALVGAPTLSLMSYDTNPAASGPRGPRCAWLKRENLADLLVDDVMEAIQKLSV